MTQREDYDPLMADFAVDADRVGELLARQTAVLLSRAFVSDPARVAGYSDEDRERWADAIQATRLEHEPMPDDFLQRFPTMRNFWRDPQDRLPARHFFARDGQALTGHVALFEREWTVEGEAPFMSGFIEDVGTDPQFAGSGIATRLMAAAVEWARASGLPTCGLSTAIPEFYERMGWVRWQASASYTLADGTISTPHRVMVLALTDESQGRLEGWLHRPLHAGLRGG